MLERTDRIALAVPGADEACETFARVFDTEIIGDEADSEAGARRVTLQWGQDLVELYEPTGDGPVADFLNAGRRGLFAAGFSMDDPAALAADLERAGVKVHQQADDRFVVFQQDLDGTGLILGKTTERASVGLASKIWQITFAVEDMEQGVARYSDLFGLGDVFTNYYQSELYGYDGAITWFDARDGGRLDSLEYLRPTNPDAAVARFVRKNGSGIYMCSIESDNIQEIEKRVTSTGPGWDGTAFGGFIHPLRLHGLLVALVTYENWNRTRPLP